MKPHRDGPAHEARCRRCGVSCHLALPVNGVPVVIEGLYCRFLARSGQRWGCTVYAERFTRAPWCHHADEAGPAGFLAHDCPYLGDQPAGPARGKVVLDEAAYARVWPAILAELRRVGVPSWVHRPALLAALSRREPGRWRLEETADGRLMPTLEAP